MSPTTHPRTADEPDESFLAGIRAREIRLLFAAAATRAGVIRPGDPSDQMQVDFDAETHAKR